MKTISKKQGFTLIELLAVIVILAVIALIATPIVIGIIEDSKVKANENSAYGIIKSAEYYYTNGLVHPETKLEYNTDILGKLTYNGQNPKSGSSAYINADGEVAVALLYGKKCYVKEYSESKLKEGTPSDCKVTLPSSSKTLSEVITKGPIVTTDSGLYKISDTEYRYRGGCTLQGSVGNYTCLGADPINNYVSIDGQKYRIIAVDSQGVKVMSEEKLGKTLAFDKGNELSTSCTGETCPRNNANNTFCQVLDGSYFGCSVYAAVSGNFTAGGKTGTVTQNSTLYEYLNTTGTDAEVINLRDKALSVTWNIGAVSYGANVTMSTIYTQEQAAKAKFKLGLINTSDYIEASIDTNCKNEPLNYSTNSATCRNNNWIFNENSSSPWTINPWTNAVGTTYHTWRISSYEGSLASSQEWSGAGVHESHYGVHPVAYLSSNTLVSSGDGTSSNPWVVE